MSKKILANNACISKKPPFYQYAKGWAVDTKVKDPEAGLIRINHRWYRTYSEAKADYNNQYNLAKEAAIAKRDKKAVDTKMPFSRFLEMFSDYRLTKVRGSSFYHLDKFVQSKFLSGYGKTPIKEIFCREFAVGFKKKVMAAKLSRQYKNKTLTYYRQMCDFAFGNGLLPPDEYGYCKFATEAIGRIEENDAKKKEPKFALTDDEIALLFQSIENPVHLALVKFLFATGFRLSEALALTPAEIDFGKKTITREYEWQVDEYGTQKRLRRTKNNNEGTFPANSALLDWLYDYINAQGIKQDGALFPSKTDPNRPLETQWFRKKLRAYCKKAGIREIHPHIARHTFCTKVAEITGDSNADRKSLEVLTGHTVSVNQSVYTHVEEDTMRRIVDAINSKA